MQKKKINFKKCMIILLFDQYDTDKKKATIKCTVSYLNLQYFILTIFFFTTKELSINKLLR